MIKIADKKECCGCEGCVQSCPQHCITMKSDDEGFLYPEINYDACTNCSRCEKVCPVANYTEPKSHQKAFVVQHKDTEVVKQSASGGAFTVFADYVLSQGGVVFGAAYTAELEVQHTLIDRAEDLYKLRCSKYVQSRIGDSYKKAKEFLKEGRMVCFAGTPCQIYGLHMFLNRKEYPNLITVDFACHGVPSPKVWRRYLDWLKEKGESDLISYRFRDKRKGYQYTTFVAKYSDGAEYVISDADNDRDFMKDSFFRDVVSRPSCYDCVFKSVNHISDITLFDCWHNEELTTGKDFVDGATTVILHTDKALGLQNEIEERAKICEVNLEKAVELDGVCLVYSKLPFPKRKEYFQDLDNLTVEQMQKKYFANTGSNPVKEMIKTALRKIGLFDLMRNRIAKHRMKGL
ncbi:MAG: Coenzyme F420 hydrogenase/dehydrogenase, beta subunit C-terminal domain [Ruminococcus sp.]|nr:Coenzyme F420 hydrogenase/dehydrogenase, beta subunit C-terminal domain [Ruminococcus sp.]